MANAGHRPSDAEVPGNLLQTLRLALREYGLVGSVSRFAAQRDEAARFLREGPAAERTIRERLLAGFAAVHRNVPCAHGPLQYVIVAHHTLALGVDGCIVQCGSFKGGSTAKLSLLARATGRRLVVCDSFRGLPECEESRVTRFSMSGRRRIVFGAGEYAGSREEVEANVRSHGCIDVCDFVPGWFSETLPALDVIPAVIVTDVDYVSSARDCLTHLWPRLVSGGLWFTHEASYLEYMEGIMDPDFWRDTLGRCPPLVVGAGSGLSSAAPNLAMFRKA